MNLTLLPETFAVWKLPATAPLPQVPFFAAIRTGDELSLVTEEVLAPYGIPCERGWRVLKVAGPLDFALTGILAALERAGHHCGISGINHEGTPGRTGP